MIYDPDAQMVLEMLQFLALAAQIDIDIVEVWLLRRPQRRLVNIKLQFQRSLASFLYALDTLYGSIRSVRSPVVLTAYNNLERLSTWNSIFATALE